MIQTYLITVKLGTGWIVTRKVRAKTWKNAVKRVLANEDENAKYWCFEIERK